MTARLVAFLKEFYDEDTRSFTLSCVRDLYKGLLVFFCAAVFHFAVVLLRVIGLHATVTEVLSFVDDVWCVFTAAFVALVFFLKLVSVHRRRK